MTTINKPSAAAVRAAERITPSSNPARQKAVKVAAADIDREFQPLVEALEALEACVQAGVIPQMDSLPRTPTEIGKLTEKVHTAIKRARGEET